MLPVSGEPRRLSSFFLSFFFSSEEITFVTRFSIVNDGRTTWRIQTWQTSRAAVSFSRRDERIETRERDRTKGYNPGTNQLYVVFHTSYLCVPLYTSLFLSLCRTLLSLSPTETFRSTRPSTSLPLPYPPLPSSPSLGYYSFTWVRLYNVHRAHVCYTLLQLRLHSPGA